MWENFPASLQAEQAGKTFLCEKNFPLDCETRQGKKSSQWIILPSAWRLIILQIHSTIFVLFLFLSGHAAYGHALQLGGPDDKHLVQGKHN